MFVLAFGSYRVSFRHGFSFRSQFRLCILIGISLKFNNVCETAFGQTCKAGLEAVVEQSCFGVSPSASCRPRCASRADGEVNSQ